MYHFNIMLINSHWCCSSSSLVYAVLLLLLVLVQLQRVASAPLLSTSAALRRTHMHNSYFDQLDQLRNNNNNNNNNKLVADDKKRYEKQMLAMIKQYQDNLLLNTNNQKVEKRDEDVQRQREAKHEPQMVGMRVLNSWGGYWDWMEAETHSVYLFAFTYFGVITLVLVSLLILVSCCYMYDCMGCYDVSLAEKCHTVGIGGDGAKTRGNSVFPMAPPSYSDCTKLTVVYSNNKIGKSSSGRRWSSPIVQL